MSDGNQIEFRQTGGHREPFEVPPVPRPNFAGAVRNYRDLGLPSRDRRIPFDGLVINGLLTALPGEDLARLLPYFEPVALDSGQSLYESGGEVIFAYFPQTTVVSKICSLTDGRTTEAAVIGYEGMVGLASILDDRAPSYSTKVTIGGKAVKISREDLQREFRAGTAIREILLKYAARFISQLSQRVVCNGSHHLDERLSTWLLMLDDRTNGEVLPLTHEQIGNHLGARRAGITNCCNDLRAAGAIDYRRGSINILSREIMEAAACECYQTLCDA